MIFLLLNFDYTAWLDHPGLLNLGYFWPLFFVEWRIFKKSNKSTYSSALSKLAVQVMQVHMAKKGKQASTRRVVDKARMYVWVCIWEPDEKSWPWLDRQPRRHLIILQHKNARSCYLTSGLTPSIAAGGTRVFLAFLGVDIYFALLFPQNMAQNGPVPPASRKKERNLPGNFTVDFENHLDWQILCK